MRQFLLIPLCTILLFCKGNNKLIDKSQAVSYETQIVNYQSDSLLVGIQEKIYNAFTIGMMTKSSEALNKLGSELEQVYKEKSHNIILYWRSYLQFYASIFYLHTGDKVSAEKEIDKGIEWLDKMERKNSEDYALLALLQSFGMQFKGMKAMFIAEKVKQNAEAAIDIDSTNLRAYYVLGNNDYYTPEKYGGGNVAEKYLLKAISLPEQKISNVYLPSWGKEEAFEMLIKFYIKKEKWELAKKYFQEGIDLFPKSYTINQLASKLINK